jgi:CelD/BcsL family acetyltransferase involved in cellulose biosynthesis
MNYGGTIGSQLARQADTVLPQIADAAGANSALGQPLESRLSLVTTLAALTALEPAWKQLERDCDSASGLFQSYAWVYNWCSAYIREGSSFELCILAGFEAERLVFVWPLMKVRESGLNIVKWLTEPFGQYGDVLLGKGQHAATWMTQSLSLLRRLKNIDGIRLRHVRDDAVCARFLEQQFDDARLTEFAPCLDLTAFADEAAYEARYTSVQRKRRKKIRKALEQIGEVDFHQIPAGSMADAAIDEALTEKTRWLAARGRHNRFLKCPVNAQFLKQLSRCRDEDFQTIVTEITVDAKPVSWEIGYNYRGTHYGYITSHREDMTNLSPARLHMDLSQRLSLKQGMQRFDLMVPNDAHKESWSSHKVACRDYYKPMSRGGYVYGQLYLRGLRPQLRSFYYAAPPWLLRWVATLAAVIIAR